MKKIDSFAALALVGMAMLSGPGCRKASVDPKVVEGASKLPGATEVMAAIDKKDYDGAMASLMKVKQSLTTEAQNLEFLVLARQVRDKMSEAAATDPKAAEAVMALRAMTTGGR